MRWASRISASLVAALFTPERRCTALRAAWGASEHDIVALYVGRIAPEKNVERAVEAYRAMQRVGGARRFVLVGDGPQRAALQKRHPDLVFPGASLASSSPRTMPRPTSFSSRA